MQEPRYFQDGAGALSRFAFEILPGAPVDTQRRLGFLGALYAQMPRSSWARAKALACLAGLEHRHAAVDAGGPDFAPLAGLLTAPARPPGGVPVPLPTPLADIPAGATDSSGGITFLELRGPIAFGSCRGLLAELKGARAVDLRIDSIGGDLGAALEIGEALAHCPVSVATVTGMALSAAVVVLQGARTRRMVANGEILIHAPRGALVGTSDELRREASELESYMPRVLALFHRAPRRTIIGMMKNGRDHWFTATEAKAARLIDQVIPAPVRTLAPMAADGQGEADAALVALAADLLRRLQGAAKDQAAFRGELSRRLGLG
jgi:ATP-dependent protease ClpP protease subunit